MLSFISNKETGKPSFLLIGMIIISIICLILCGVLSSKAYAKGEASANAAYMEAKEKVKEETYQGIYDISFEKSEEKTHVSNRVAINVNGATEISRLEVLKVYDTEAVVENAEDNPGNVTSWENATGTGVYTVDMSAAEYLIDSERQFVTVRVPKPELSQLSVLTMDNLFLKNDLFDDSVADGVDLAQKQRDKANAAIRDSIRRNERYEKCALESAESMIKELIISLNPEATELQVLVEFTED